MRNTIQQNQANNIHSMLLLLIACALASVGLVMVASASIDVADIRYGNPFYFTQRHAIYLMMAGIAAMLAYQVHMKVWQRSGAALLVFAYILLVLVLVPGIGRTVNGSTRWISLGLITIQVSEIAKIFVLVYVAGYLVRRQHEVQGSFWGFMKPVLVLSLMVLLLLKEPDFGAVVVIMSAVFAMLFLGGVKFSQFSLVMLGSALAGAALVWSSEYRWKRITGYIDPWADQFSSGYQLVQSLIAFGRGDMTGVGLGNGIQKLFYLPEAHTDFVFAIFAEETGLVGSLSVITLFMVLVLVVLSIGQKAERLGAKFNAYLAYGFGVMIGLQAFINIGVCSGLLPTKGLTLPLISYGGSSLIVNAVIIAILLRISKENQLMALGQIPIPTDEMIGEKSKGDKEPKGKRAKSSKGSAPTVQMSFMARWLNGGRHSA
ncbi:MAG: putative lipid II flippase FtsW [Pseudomonadales bacterium]|nr:putative lipid II flippase FtsW [Pseudomonadales bacterium]